jgi:hypothetical protein
VENVEIYPAAKAWLTVEHAVDVHSQFGENGLSRRALAQIGVRNRWCFEVGANDGVYFSNTKWLRDDGWSALLIEAEADHFEKLKKFRSDRVRCRRERIGRTSLDMALAEHGAPRDLDFGCIDIDGQDYWVWEGMVEFKPRLMLVEFSPADDPPPKQDGARQAGKTAILALGDQKGYTILATTRVNALFARNDCL